jgi:hypothetical protein
MLKPQVKIDWLAALRSGEYKQGRKRLCSIHTDGVTYHCCLGVLSELAMKAMPDKIRKDMEIHNNEEQVYAYSTEDESNTELLIGAIEEWAFTVDVGIVTVAKANGIGRVPLHRLNDTGTSFEEIAKMIERDL